MTTRILVTIQDIDSSPIDSSRDHNSDEAALRSRLLHRLSGSRDSRGRGDCCKWIEIKILIKIKAEKLRSRAVRHLRIDQVGQAVHRISAHNLREALRIECRGDQPNNLIANTIRFHP